MRACPDCGGTLTKSTIDQHPYRYDHGKSLRLLALNKHACACGYYEIEIPKMEPLHETIAQTLKVLHVKRDAVAFIFKEGPGGVIDGEWAVLLPTAQ
jgi:hypothetical protein